MPPKCKQYTASNKTVNYEPPPKRIDVSFELPPIMFFVVVIGYSEKSKGYRCILVAIVKELLRLEMIGSLRIVKLVGVKNHKMWKLKKLGYKFLCL